MATHDVGDVVTLWVAFRDAAGAQAAPTTVTLYAKRPEDPDSLVVHHVEAEAGEEAQAEAAIGAALSGVTGVYRAELEADAAGLWRYEWLGTGAVAERQPGWFEVRARRLADPPGSLIIVAAAASAALDGTVTGP